MPKYLVTISFTGKAMVDVPAATAEAARHIATEMSLSDLALTGKVDLLNFRIVPGEINKVVTNEGDEVEEDSQPKKPRPSGWYRPRYE